MDIPEILRQIDSFKKEAENLQPVKPEFERAFWEKFRLEFNYNSNHIEGNTLTYGQTKLLLLFDRTTGDNKGREIEEMKSHDVALKMITEISADKETPLTEKLIREINELILVRPFYNDAITPNGQPTKRLITPGEYKKQPNSVLLPDGSMFYYASPEETPALMGDLIEWYNQNKEATHPVRLAALMHYKLVRIHPFDDSNGRTTRLIMNFILMQNGYAPIVIESKKKDEYLAALNKADVGDISAFEKYIADVSFKWEEIFLKAMKGEKIEEEGDLEKKIDVLKKNLSSENEIEIKKELSTIKDFTTKYYIPFLKFFDNQLAKLDQFFFERHILIRGSNLSRKYNSLNSIEQFSSDFTNVLFHSSSLNISFTHKGLKKAGKREWGHTSEVSIICKEYEYRIEFAGLNEKITKQYRDPLTIEDYSSLIEKVIKKEVLEIEKKLSS